MEDDKADAVLIDLDTVMLDMHQGRRGVELNLTADMAASLERLREVTQRIAPTAARRRLACKPCTAASAAQPTISIS